jgi:hypothetical protein
LEGHGRARNEGRKEGRRTSQLPQDKSKTLKKTLNFFLKNKKFKRKKEKFSPFVNYLKDPL